MTCSSRIIICYEINSLLCCTLKRPSKLQLLHLPSYCVDNNVRLRKFWFPEATEVTCRNKYGVHQHNTVSKVFQKDITLTGGVAAWKTLSALRHQAWFSCAQHFRIHLAVWEAAVEVIWSWPDT